MQLRTPARGVLQRFDLALRAFDLEDGALGGYLLLGCEPAGVGNGVAGGDTYVSGAKHVQVGECGGEAAVFALRILIEQGRWLADVTEAAKSSWTGMASVAGIAFILALGSGCVRAGVVR
jgi:hypothetical protein